MVRVQLTLMLMVPGKARADIVLREDRIYYRFATVDTEEDGDLPGLKQRFTAVAERLLQNLQIAEGEDRVDADDLYVKVFVDNVAKPIDVSYSSIRRTVDELLRIDDIFAFLQGFCA